MFPWTTANQLWHKFNRYIFNGRQFFSERIKVLFMVDVQGQVVQTHILATVKALDRLIMIDLPQRNFYLAIGDGRAWIIGVMARLYPPELSDKEIGGTFKS